VVNNLFALLRHRQNIDPDGPAIVNPNGTELSFSQFGDEITNIGSMLGQNGRRLRVAVVFSNGPEFAALFYGIACFGACVPLNQAYKKHEFEFYLKEFKIDLLIVENGLSEPAESAAKAVGVETVSIERNSDWSHGLFKIRDHGRQIASPANDDDIALLLHTSGTTGKPKLVPIRQRNVIAMLGYMNNILKMERSDRGLNVMPLYHLHGLRLLMTSISSGGSVCCTPSFSVEDFYSWYAKIRPSWLTCSPIILSAILEEVRKNPERALDLNKSKLRFIHTSSSPLSNSVRTEAEKIFSAPIYDVYGLSEATPISVNCSATKFKAGTVGVPSGPTVAIVDKSGKFLPPGSDGEIAVSGPNVIDGYENNPQANKDSFSNNWFRTGDLGRLDKDGFLVLLGRNKDVINRGGEKIYPLEIDDLLLKHPAVQNAAVFALPHLTLGEEVAAVVSLREGSTASSAELQDYLREQLAEFKIPKQIFFSDKIPSGATGKIRRSALSKHYGDLVAMTVVPPKTAIEIELANLWASHIGVDINQVGVNSNFFALGGDSISAISLLDKTNKVLQTTVKPNNFFLRPTIRELIDADHSQHGDRISVVPRNHEPLRGSFFQDDLATGLKTVPSFGNNMLNLRFMGKLNVEALKRSIQLTLDRHEVLRSSFAVKEGKTFMSVSDSFAVDVQSVDLRMLKGDELESKIRALATECSMRPFDIGKSPLLRFLLVRESEDEFILMMAYCHLVFDRWSAGNCLHNFLDFYCSIVTGSKSLIPDSQIQFADWAHWHREMYANGLAVSSQTNYWKKRLEGAVDSNRIFEVAPGTNPSSELIPLFWSIDSDTLVSMKRIGRQRKCSVYGILSTVLAIVLRKITGQEDSSFTAVSTIDRHLAEASPLIGPMITGLPLRSHIEDEFSFAAVLDTVQRDVLEANANALPTSLIGGPRRRVNLNFWNVPPNLSFALPGVNETLVLPKHLCEPLKLTSLGLVVNHKLPYLDFRNMRAMDGLDANVIFTEIAGELRSIFWHRSDLVPAEREKPKEIVADFKRILAQVLTDPQITVKDL